MITDEIGVSIASFNRPDYLVQLLASLERQTNLERLAFHLFQDGAVNVFDGKARADEADIVGSLQVFWRAKLPNKTIHLRKCHAGIGINQFDAIEWMTANYEYVVMLENDVVLSPHWMRLTRVLFEQVKDRQDIFSFCLGFRKACSGREALRKLGKTAFARHHWWGEALLSERWAVIRPQFMEYYALIESRAYSKRPHDAIRDLYRRNGWAETATSQDGGKDMAVFASGLRRICTVVNRGISIGEMGIHWRPGFFKAKGYGDQEPYIFEEDATLEEFVLPRAAGEQT